MYKAQASVINAREVIEPCCVKQFYPAPKRKRAAAISGSATCCRTAASVSLMSGMSGSSSGTSLRT
eukprot:13299225-Alexandrium_andersonii.AAC.1